MMTGKRPLIDVNIYTALLRHSLMPPDAWNETEAILQRLEALRYLERCANGVEKYNPESMSAVMPDKSVVMVIVKPRESIPDAPTERTALTGDSGAATPDKCDNTSGRPWTRSVTTLVSPTSPSKKRKASPEPSLQSKSSPPKRKKATPKRRTTPKKQATPKKTVEQPVIGGSSTKHNGVAQAQDQADSPTSSLRRARRNPVVTSETLAGDNHYILLAKIFKATEVLGQVARYEDKCVRRVALSSFIADLHKAGWTDLEKSAVQLIKDEDCASREFLASMIVNSSYERINEALDKDAAPTKTACDSRPSPWRRVPRILFKSG
ncbi:uncharacterized protein GLRG_06211 [Colletotrichum graminicola M1.001]|uniref:Uncharacterized protein n=1 Tax=Colletotrichum graminicola (strain M1.001 / M2 / FGSC 10212) TaxID=645133 RepID=E3QJM9_COLGM|nr:uncharacterized protein GLRG_06211 [Colletotrichum graminicola M1.001]EFQ31067.1 hypothetical protein GLRG_06211 [Colletotrichum graminicola M1.001]